MRQNPLNNPRGLLTMNAIDNTGNAPKHPRTHIQKAKKSVIPSNLPQSTQIVPQPVGTEPIQIPPELLKILDEKLSDNIKKEIENKKHQTITDYKPLENMVSEYLKSFLIIGYGLNGEKIFIGHANTAEQHDSLVEHLRQSFINVIENMPM